MYDGDGNRVKATVNGVTTVYVGNSFEQSGTVTKTYVYAGGQRVALRQGSTVYYLLGDHLGSTAITANGSGGLHAELRYKPWGENRYTYGTTPTTFRYTGQREEVGLGSLYFYQARYYSPVTGRFISADTIVPQPGNPQAWNRYSYVFNNPLKYTDPSGHDPWWCSSAQCRQSYYASVQSRSVAVSSGPKIISDPVEEFGTSLDIFVGISTGPKIISDPVEDFGSLIDIFVAVPREPKIIADPPLERSGIEDMIRRAGKSGGSNKDSNVIGQQGAQQVGDQLPIQIGRFPIKDEETGKIRRIYDGIFKGTDDGLVEIKSSESRRRVMLDDRIREEINFDAGRNPKPMWIFNNTQPSRGVMRLLQQHSIPWHQLHNPNAG